MTFLFYTQLRRWIHRTRTYFTFLLFIQNCTLSSVSCSPVIIKFCWILNSCRFDLTKEPHRCCGLVDCMSMSEKVTRLLHRDILEVQLAARFAEYEDQNEPRPENFRFIAYRNLVFMLYGRTRVKMPRLPLPSCFVLRVRDLYPDPNENYTNFKTKRVKSKE